ncbi:MAG TPA: beta-3-deoxy-D-manno-oct-2-ulosonic acid transferase [Sphingomicrobium sp.]|jgi:capsular polysaccharide export protein
MSEPTLANQDTLLPAPLLEVPPFPRARHAPLAERSAEAQKLTDAEVERLAARAAEAGFGTVSIDEFRSRAVDGWRYRNPFSGEPMDLAEAIELCAFWRQLIESNGAIDAAIGFASWKRETVEPLLWSGRQMQFVSRADAVPEGSNVALWRSRTPPAQLAELEKRAGALIEVEDGFIRSAGLGADCVPPLSIVVDRLGAHFDPSKPSELEQLIEAGGCPPDVVARARELRRTIVDAGLSKYSAGGGSLDRRSADRRHILVPGQVEDDRSVVEGGGAVRSNLELLRRVRTAAPDAYIIYKPHPDIEAGHRVGAIKDSVALELADEIVRDGAISPLISLVDEVHVITSLAGFEALLRGKRVVTHGVPFYAGWGLTTDLGDVPGRRTARPTIDELVAAVLLIYPRYLDPVTGLPCPAEVVVERLSGGGETDRTLIVALRRVQGRIMGKLRGFFR